MSDKWDRNSSTCALAASTDVIKMKKIKQQGEARVP